MTAYYNEFDPGAAAWLRELIKAGLIADGDVDERSILDVRHSELRSYTQCHFFAGIGGWSYALRLADWPDDRPVWTGSPPCQPFSVAGAGKGRDDARHLAPHFISLVGDARPGVLFGEQVASADVFGKAAKRARGNFVAPPDWAWLDDLSDRLEAARYAVGASDFPSAGVGAPHIRQRTFFGAVSHEWLANHAGLGWIGRRAGEAGFEPGAQQRSDGFCDAGGMADRNSEGRLPGAQRGIHRSQEVTGPRHGEPERSGDACGLVYGLGAGLEGHGGNGGGSREPGRFDAHAPGSVAAAGADGGMDHTDGWDACSEWEQSCGQHGQQQEDGGTADADYRPGPLHGFWRDADWLFCRDGKWRPVEPAVLGLVDGLPGCVVPSGPFVPASYPLAQGGKDARRVMRLRGYGNAINPHAAAEFIRSFDDAVGGVRVAS